MRTHGWLCDGHWQQEQRSIPPNARKAQPRWRGLSNLSDAEIIADIIAQDKRAIAEGKVARIQRGAQDPVFLKLLEPPTVH